MFLLQDVILQPIKTEKDKGKSEDEKGKENKPKISDWRFGPAQLWYDMLGIDEAEEQLDYGFKLKEVVHFVFSQNLSTDSAVNNVTSSY